MINPLTLWASDFAWTDWLLVAGARKGLFRTPGPAGAGQRLEIHALPFQGEGQLIHKGGWITDDDRDAVLRELARQGHSPASLARTFEDTPALPDALERIARRLAAAEGRVCERMVNEPHGRFRAQLHLPPQYGVGDTPCDE